MAIFGNSSTLLSTFGASINLDNSNAAPSLVNVVSATGADSNSNSNSNEFSMLLENAVTSEMLEIEVPQTLGEKAFQLLPLRGNEFPAVGESLPLSDASAPAVEVFQDSTDSTSQLSATDTLKTVQEDIEAWLQDPDIAFVSGQRAASEKKVSVQPALEALPTTIPIQSKATMAALPQQSPPAVFNQSKDNSEMIGHTTVEPESRSSSITESKHATTTLPKEFIPQGPNQFFEQLKLEQKDMARNRKFSLESKGIEGSSRTHQATPNPDMKVHNYFEPVTEKPTTSQSSISAAFGSITSDHSMGSLNATDAFAQTGQSVSVAIEQWRSQTPQQAIGVSDLDASSKLFPFRLSVPVSETGWSENLGKQLSMLMARNMDSAQIQIDPPELGTMQVKIVLNNEQVSLQFNAAQPAVREALEASVERLQAMLFEEGLDLKEFHVGDQSPGDGQGGSRHDSEGRSATENSQPEADLNVDNLTLVTMDSSDDGKIDYFI